ncbi:MAG: hypothetical protein ABSG03_01580 [Bryobacteraceae bacterium]|jgi:hypothetical protein
MIELADTAPLVDIQPAEYNRLLGYPPGWTLEGRARELADMAADWFARHGRPWVYARQAESLYTANGSIQIDGVSFTSPRLQSTLQRAEAHSVILVAAGAGPELECEAQRRWRDEKPDEYFFLEMYGSAVVERLVTMTGARLCSWAEQREMAVLPHYSPGYPEWDIGEQSRLLGLVTQSGRRSLPSPLEALCSGALRPKKSLLAVFGLTHHVERVRPLTGLVPCENCSFTPCQYRRAPYVRAPESSNLIGLPANSVPARSASPLNLAAKYGVNAKALKRWAGERLSLESRADGATDAVFRYDGTTCSNMGRPLTFHYTVKLGPPEDGYLIREQQCVPAPGDTGHTHMCQFDNGRLLTAIDGEKPMLGQPLDDVLFWQRPDCAAGCYCDPAGREHKWGLVLETIHYALTHRENLQ